VSAPQLGASAGRGERDDVSLAEDVDARRRERRALLGDPVASPGPARGARLSAMAILLMLLAFAAGGAAAYLLRAGLAGERSDVLVRSLGR